MHSIKALQDLISVQLQVRAIHLAHSSHAEMWAKLIVYTVIVQKFLWVGPDVQGLGWNKPKPQNVRLFALIYEVSKKAHVMNVKSSSDVDHSSL